MIYSAFYAKLTPNGGAVGTKFSISLSGITGVVGGQQTYNSSPLYFSVKPKSSGRATVTFKNDNTGEVIGTRQLLVRSLTLAKPTYSLTSSATSVNEGGTVTFTLDTSDVPVNSTFAYSVTGINAADLETGTLTGSFKIGQDGFARVSFKLKEDELTEGTETMTLSIASISLSKAVTINDTSKAPTYSVGWYSNTGGTTAITSMNEGATAYVVVKTTNVANGTILPITLTGTAANTTDLSTPVSGNITINNNIGHYTVTTNNDLTTEGDEAIAATVKKGTVTVGTANIAVKDTSLTPVPTYTLVTSTTSVNEGSTITFTLTTTNVTNGTTIPYAITGVSVSDISLSSLTGNFTVNNNVATLTIPIVADNLTEGNETLVITLTGKNIAKSVIINDTSVATNTGYVFNSVKNNPAAAYEFRGINTVSYSVNLGWGKVHPGPFGSVVTDDLYVDTTKLNIIRVVNYYASLGYEDYAGYVEIDTSTNVPNIKTATVKLTDLSNGTVVFNKSATIVNRNPLELFVSGVTSTAFDIPVGVQLKLQLTTT